ncbi:hypothetical protein [Pelomonas sp. KK5]|uniref:hypothetical protein n=1 Tax=Pelomonas sp. KK5 TaxID=1855730 RepID=UPI001180FE4A|nr:hypothetical protein [Pelomonas sp. KK5]
MTTIDSTAREPETRSALRAAIAFLARRAPSLNRDQLKAGDELKRRLRRLEAECNRLIKINNTLMQAELPRMSHNPTADTLTMTYGGVSHSIKLNRADPSAPVTLDGATAIGTYGSDDEHSRATPEIQELKILFESLLEQYYYNAFRIAKLLQELTGRTKSHCTEITMVRNHLVEHPKDDADYTFGYGTHGPVVRPIKRGTPAWNDAGLVPNTVALVKHILSELAR